MGKLGIIYPEGTEKEWVWTRQQIEVENFELEKALKELEKTSEKDPVYKSTGTIMIKSNLKLRNLFF